MTQTFCLLKKKFKKIKNSKENFFLNWKNSRLKFTRKLALDFLLIQKDSVKEV